MSESLYRLVYYSHNRVEGGAEDLAREVAQILAASRVNNARAGVTGALMFNQGCFAQVLEGPREAVEGTFERIQQDDRHGDVLLLSFGPTDARGFADWSMAYVGASVAQRERYRAIEDAGGFDLARVRGERVFEVLHAMVLEEERRAA